MMFPVKDCGTGKRYKAGKSRPVQVGLTVLGRFAVWNIEKEKPGRREMSEQMCPMVSKQDKSPARISPRVAVVSSNALPRGLGITYNQVKTRMFILATEVILQGSIRPKVMDRTQVHGLSQVHSRLSLVVLWKRVTGVGTSKRGRPVHPYACYPLWKRTAGISMASSRIFPDASEMCTFIPAVLYGVE